MILESIQKRRNKVILSFDNSEVLEIYYDVYLTLLLYKGDKITSKKFEEIKMANAEYEVKNSAFRYLSNRSHSTFELRTKLKKKEYNIDIINKVLDELLEKKYLNDFQFAQNFVRNRIERRKEGIIKITSELYKKGISRDIITEIMKSTKENPQILQNALELGQKKMDNILKRGEKDVRKIKSKLFNYLKGRGFTSNIIFEVMDDILEEE